MESKEIRPGVTTIKFTAAEIDEMYTKIAAGYGMTLAQYKAALKKDSEENWCKCETEGDPLFCDDGETRNRHCCSKHHYHCSNCGKLTQVG